MARSNVRVWLVFLGIPILLVLGALGYLAWRQSVPAVARRSSTGAAVHRGAHADHLVLRASRGGVESVDIRLHQGGTRVNVAQQTFSGGPAGNEQRVQLIVAGGTLGLREGAATLEVRARDGFWRPIRVDDRMIANVPVMLDFTPPTLEILASTRYLSRGGGGLVALRAKGAARVGVNVGDLFFPGFPAGAPDTGLTRCSTRCRGTWPPNAPVTATAQDEAGNAVSRAPRGGHPPAPVPDGHHRGERAVPREQDAGAPARARARSRPTSSSPPS